MIAKDMKRGDIIVYNNAPIIVENVQVQVIDSSQAAEVDAEITYFEDVFACAHHCTSFPSEEAAAAALPGFSFLIQVLIVTLLVRIMMRIRMTA